MELVMLYHPVKDLPGAIAFYNSVLHWEESWREGDFVVAFKIPGSEGIEVMLESDESDSAVPGGVFMVNSVDEFYHQNRDVVRFLWPPRDIPPGRYTAFVDPAGNVIRLLDFTRR